MVGGDGRWTMEEGREIAVHGYIQSSSYRKKQKLNTAKNKSEMPQKTKICLALCWYLKKKLHVSHDKWRGYDTKEGRCLMADGRW